jgi:hypothetical protein
MENAKQLLVAVSIWVVLFVALTPGALRDGTGFRWDEPWTWALAVALGICIWGFRELIRRVRGWG